MKLWVVLVAMCLSASAVQARETDQFSVPPQPLYDLGPEFDHRVELTLEQIVNHTNTRYEQLITKAAAASSPSSRDRYINEAAECLTNDYLLFQVYRSLGRDDSSAFTKSLGNDIHIDQPMIFAPSLGKTIYGGSLAAIELTLVTMSGTIKLHGTYLGTDKIGHMFQQGYEYYEDYSKARHNGASRDQAIKKAVEGGVDQEHGIYGETIDGMYSNADLAANYAGLRFYLNLVETMTIDGQTYPPLVQIKDGRWQCVSRADCMKPFFSDHLNEAFNPCRYAWHLRGSIRNRIKDRSASFTAFYKINPDAEIRREQEMRTWHGEDYGRIDDSLITITNAFYNDRPQTGVVAQNSRDSQRDVSN